MPKSARVRKRREYLELQKDGQRIVVAHFVFFVRRRADDEGARLGLIVSRKVGNAVVRNRVKRLCRELFRLHATELLPPNYDCVVLARAGAAEVALRAMHDEWRRALTRLRREPRA